MYAQAPGIPNVAADGFDALASPISRGRLLGRPVYWHGAQWRFTTRSRSDVLILSWDLHYASLVPSLLRARWAGVPTILWGHGYSKNEAAWRRRLRERAGRLGTALLFYNRATAGRYRDDGWDPDRLFVAPNSLDQMPIRAAITHWRDRPDRLQQFREQQGLDRGPVIMFVSRLDPANRLDLLVRATGELAAKHPQIQTVIVGEGDQERSRLASLADSIGVSQSVRFLGPIYDEQDLAPWFLSADVFCYPANIGLSLLHAFGYGLPVVTSRNTEKHNPEIEALEDGVNGLLYEDGDASALTQTLGTLLASPDRARAMGQAGLRTVTQKYTVERMVDGMEAAIRYCTLQRG